MMLAIGSIVFLATTVSADVTCGDGTVLDEATNQCVVGRAPVRRQTQPQLVTEDGNLLVQTTQDGRFGVRQADGTTTYADEANAIPAAIQLGYNIFRDVQDLHDVISVRETLRGEIVAAADSAREQRTALRNEVNASVTQRLGQAQEILDAANTSLSEVSGSLRTTLSQMVTCADRGSLLGEDGRCVQPGETCAALSTITRNGNATFRGDLKEPAVGAQETVVCTQSGFGPNPRVLQCRRDGTWSNTTVGCQNCSLLASQCPTGTGTQSCDQCADGACTQCRVTPKGSRSNPGDSCLDILESYAQNSQIPRNGMYQLKVPGSSSQYETYCDHETDGGGWTLISSVHEDNVAAHQPNQQDRWTGQSTNTRGARAWYDNLIFGNAAQAAQSDFKSKAYNLVNGSNTMVWHVSNGAEAAALKSSAWARYYTDNDFLSNLNPANYVGIFSGNRRTMLHSRRCGVKLTVPIIWDTENAGYFYNQIADNVRDSHMGGRGGSGENKMDYSIGCDGDCGNCMFAVCPGVSFTNGCGNTEHACIGGAISRGNFQSDFTEWDHCGLASPSRQAFCWSSGGKIVRSAVLFFVR